MSRNRITTERPRVGTFTTSARSSGCLKRARGKRGTRKPRRNRKPRKTPQRRKRWLNPARSRQRKRLPPSGKRESKYVRATHLRGASHVSRNLTDLAKCV